MSDQWAYKVKNPEALGAKEKELYADLEPKIRALLHELNQNGVIETVLVKQDTARLGSVLEKLDEFSELHNTMNHIFVEDVIPRFLGANKQFGITEPIAIRIWEAANLLTSLLSTELFKLLVLFHLKRGLGQDAYKISNFNNTMSKYAPSSWPELQDSVDNAFRNSIAHGTYAFLKKDNQATVETYKDATLELLKPMALDEFMIRTKEQNVLYACGFNVLLDLKKGGWVT